MNQVQWSEPLIIRAIARQTLAAKCIVLVDNCNWTGNECDVLGVTMDMRVIDVEVKISRTDLKADGAKSKWWKLLSFAEATERGLIDKTAAPFRWDPWSAKDKREWPRKVWKHYYAMPAAIWKPELMATLPSKSSGVLLLSEQHNGTISVKCERRATPNRDADKLSPEQALDIARLANLRMWDAYQREETARADLRKVMAARDGLLSLGSS